MKCFHLRVQTHFPQSLCLLKVCVQDKVEFKLHSVPLRTKGGLCVFDEVHYSQQSFAVDTEIFIRQCCSCEPNLL